MINGFVPLSALSMVLPTMWNLPRSADVFAVKVSAVTSVAFTVFVEIVPLLITV